MKVSKRQLKRIIREEKAKLLNETRGGIGVGFAGFESNRDVDFARAYGPGAQVIRDFGSNAHRQNQMKEGQLAGNVPYRVQDGIDSFGWRMSEEINGMLSQLDPRWPENPDIITAVERMLDNVKAEIKGFEEM